MTLLGRLKEFCNSITFHRFKNSNKFRMHRNDYLLDMEAAYASGAIILSQALMQSHKKNPYENVDEFVADVHLALHDFWNHYAKGSKHYKELTIEQILEKEDLFNEVFK